MPPDSNPQNFKFWGSVMTAVGATREEVIEKLKNDPYSQADVWDWDKAQIMPVRRLPSAPSPRPR